MRQAVLLILGLIFLVSYQNFTYVEWSAVKLTPINDSLRAKHACELLGRKYGQISSLKNVHSKSKLHQRLHNLIKDNLEEKDMTASLDITKAIITESQKYKMDPLFVLAIIKTESKFNPDAVGSHGEIGLMQIRPETAEWIAEKQGIKLEQNWTLTDPTTNIKIGTAYFAYLRSTFKKRPRRYIAAYNMGPRNVRKLYSRNVTPKEYSDQVLKNYVTIYKEVNNRLAMQEI